MDRLRKIQCIPILESIKPRFQNWNGDAIDRAEEIVLMNVFPGPLRHLGPAIREVLERRVQLCIQAYEPVSFLGVQVITHMEPEHAFSRWPGQQLSLVVDAREHMLALLIKIDPGVGG